MIIDNDLVFIQLILLDILRILIKSLIDFCFKKNKRASATSYLKEEQQKNQYNDFYSSLYYEIINQGLLVRLYKFLLLFYCFESLNMNFKT